LFNPLCGKKEWLARASSINYWNTDKPVCFVLSYVVFVKQQYKEQHEKYTANNRKYEEYARETRAPYLNIIKIWGARWLVKRPISGPSDVV